MVVNIRDGTSAAEAYTKIRDMIVTLRLPPGTTVKEGALQRELGIGRTPIREALGRLAQEGMVHIFPRRAIVVAKLGVPEVRQIFEMRLVLEAASARFAAERVSDEELRDLRRLAAELEESRQQIDPRGFLVADQALHRRIARDAQNTYLAACLDHILTLNLWLWHSYFAGRGAHGADLFSHAPIIAAVAAHDGEASAAAMREHILASKEHLLSGL